MNDFFKHILTVFVVVLTLSSCNKAVSDEFVSYNNNQLNDTIWASNGYNTSLLNKSIFPETTRNATLIDSFDCQVEGKLSFGDSILVSIPANSCVYANGSPITTNRSIIKAEITILKKKGDFVKYATPTTNVFTLLEASNYCNIRLTKDGKEVSIAPNNQVKIKIKDTSASGNMKFFAGNAIKYFKDSLFVWSPSNDGKVDIWKDNSSIGKTLGYEYTTNRIKWFGCANYIDSNSSKSKLNVILSPNFTNKNTTVFAVLKNSKTVVNLLSNSENRTFFTYNIPVNTEFTLVAVAKINDDYYLDSRFIKNANANPISLSPYKKSLAFIVEFIDKL